MRRRSWASLLAAIEKFPNRPAHVGSGRTAGKIEKRPNAA